MSNVPDAVTRSSQAVFHQGVIRLQELQLRAGDVQDARLMFIIGWLNQPMRLRRHVTTATTVTSLGRHFWKSGESRSSVMTDVTSFDEFDGFDERFDEIFDRFDEIFDGFNERFDEIFDGFDESLTPNRESRESHTTVGKFILNSILIFLTERIYN